MTSTDRLLLIIGTAALIFAAGCITPKTYTNEYITTNNPRNAYRVANFTTEGYFSDQLVLAMQEKMPSLSLHEGDGDVNVVVSSRLTLLPSGKKELKPVITTVTLQVVRSTDQEVIYSLVKQYEVTITKKKGKVSINTAGWVNQAAGDLATGIAKAIGMEG